MVKLLSAIAIMLVLTGCSERYRYPCQDPRNWEEEMCKKPYCSANGTCPEDLRHYEKPNLFNQTPAQPTQQSKKGDCKC